MKCSHCSDTKENCWDLVGWPLYKLVQITVNLEFGQSTRVPSTTANSITSTGRGQNQDLLRDGCQEGNGMLRLINGQVLPVPHIIHL